MIRVEGRLVFLIIKVRLRDAETCMLRGNYYPCRSPWPPHTRDISMMGGRIAWTVWKQTSVCCRTFHDFIYLTSSLYIFASYSFHHNPHINHHRLQHLTNSMRLPRLPLQRMFLILILRVIMHRSPTRSTIILDPLRMLFHSFRVHIFQGVQGLLNV